MQNIKTEIVDEEKKNRKKVEDAPKGKGSKPAPSPTKPSKTKKIRKTVKNQKTESKKTVLRSRVSKNKKEVAYQGSAVRAKKKSPDRQTKTEKRQKRKK